MARSELRIEMAGLASLLPYAKNARLHSEEQVGQIAESIAAFGFNNPILIDAEGEIVAGHGRALAAAKLGMGEVPVVRLGHLSPAQIKAYRLADNRLQETGGGWNRDLLKLELTELASSGFEIAVTGFDLADFGPKQGETDPDDVGEVPKNPISRPGDLWMLGKHRVYCGDATKGDDCLKAVGDLRPRLMLTDPPYGVKFERGKFVGNLKTPKGPKHAKMENDDLSELALADFVERAFRVAPLDESAVLYCWSAPLAHGYAMAQGVRAAGFKIQSQIVWAKTPFVMGRSDYHWQHEFAWYGFRGKDHPWFGGRNKGTVWQVPKPRVVDLHPTMKPVALLRPAIENSSRPGNPVYDPFLGSGSTLIACEELGRTCLGLEISAGYVDVIVDRWQRFTGGKATRSKGNARQRAGRSNALKDGLQVAR